MITRAYSLVVVSLVGASTYILIRDTLLLGSCRLLSLNYLLQLTISYHQSDAGKLCTKLFILNH